MKIASLSLLIFLLFAGSAHAKDTVVFFYDNQINVNSVYDEFKRSNVSGHFSMKAFNIQEKDNATAQINEILTKAVNSKYNTKANGFKMEDAYSKEFSLLMNNDKQWKQIVDKLQVGANSLGRMIELKVEKVPAFVFNETEIVYGVYSFEQAYRIYNQWKAKQ